VILNDGVRVAVPHRPGIALAPEDPRARAVDGLVRSGAPLADALAAKGVRYVAIDAAFPAGRLAGAERVVSGPDLMLYRLSGTAAVSDTHPAQLPVYIAWFITFATFIWSIRVPASNLGERSLPKET
jgi:hypothetical protein